LAASRKKRYKGRGGGQTNSEKRIRTNKKKKAWWPWISEGRRIKRKPSKEEEERQPGFFRVTACFYENVYCYSRIKRLLLGGLKRDMDYVTSSGNKPKSNNITRMTPEPKEKRGTGSVTTYDYIGK